jgi:hypothetical protein
MTIPLPFLESSATDFASCHLQKMTSQAFLVGDEWVGCFIYALQLVQDSIRLCVTFEGYTESVTPGLILLTGRGTDTDLARDFTLTGEMSCDDGKLMLSKQYISDLNHSYQYSGLMTPFGIVGNWFFLTGGVIDEGLFWLWKAKWTDGLS